MQALLPADANILFNAHYLRRLPESMQNALVGKGELPPCELAEAAALLPHPQMAAAVPAHLSVPLPLSPPPLIAQACPPYRRSQSRSPSQSRRPLVVTRLGRPCPVLPAASCRSHRRHRPTASTTTISVVGLASVSLHAAGIRKTSDCPASHLYRVRTINLDSF
jgi:hypothetical protein